MMATLAFNELRATHISIFPTRSVAHLTHVDLTHARRLLSITLKSFMQTLEIFFFATNFLVISGLISKFYLYKSLHTLHCVKSIRIWSYSGPHFSAFGLNTERYYVPLRI